MHRLERFFLYFDSNFTEVFSEGSNSYWVSNMPGNGLVLSVNKPSNLMVTLGWFKVACTAQGQYLNQCQFIVNKRVSEMRAPLVTHREPVGVQNRQQSVLYVFAYKTKNILIHDPHTHIVLFWHISNIPPRISWSQICYNTPILYTTGSWLFSLKANIRCLGAHH